MAAMIELLKALAMILFCLMPLFAIVVIAIWSHSETSE